MKKDDLIQDVFMNTDLTLKQAKEAVQCTFDAMMDYFKRGHGLEIRNFGSFSVIERKEKVARNISKGESIIVPARKTVKFKLSKGVKI